MFVIIIINPDFINRRYSSRTEKFKYLWEAGRGVFGCSAPVEEVELPEISATPRKRRSTLAFEEQAVARVSPS